MTEQTVVALAADLLFASRIRATGEAVGVGVHLVRTAAAVLEALRNGSTRLVILDLETRGLDATALVAALREHESAPRVVAFAAHTHTDVLALARAAGADRVLARSAFVRELPGLLAEVRS